MPRMPVHVLSFVLALPVCALAGEVTYQFRTTEDPQAARADPNACQVAPFQANVRLPGVISVLERTPAEGKRKSDGQKRVGSALACVRITDRTFSEGSQADIYARFELPEGRFVAVGKCTAVSNAVPRAGVVLASCGLKLTEVPATYAGGSATSASLFNPLGLPGYPSGSIWTLRVFEPEPAPVSAPGAGKEPAKVPGSSKAPAPPAGPK